MFVWFVVLAMDRRLQNGLSKCTTIPSSPKVYTSFWSQVGIFVLKMSIHYRNLGTHYTLGTQLAAGGYRTHHGSRDWCCRKLNAVRTAGKGKVF